MKILVVTPYYYPTIGGLENYARQLAIALKIGQGAEIVVVTSTAGRRRSVEVIDGLTVYRLPYWFKLSNTPVNPLWVGRLRAIIRAERPDVIHAHTPVPTMADAAALAAGRTPLVISYHAATLVKAGSPLMRVVTWAYRIYERLTLGRATRILAVSEFVKVSLPKALQAKTEVVPNAIWQDEITGRTEPSDLNFIYMGSLAQTHRWKGVAELITAIGLYRNRYGVTPQLTIVGDGSARPRYEALVRTLGLSSQVVFIGALTGDAKDKLLTGATALVAYPTTGNDAFPTVFLEAWAKGVPIVAAAIGPIPSLITDGQTGYLVAPNNPAALAEVLHRVATDPAGRARVAAAGESLVRRRYTWEAQAKRTAKLLEQLS